MRAATRAAAACAGMLLSAGAAASQTAETLLADGYARMECTFTERCVIGQACERAWRQQVWYLNDATGLAYRQRSSGRMRQAELRLDARWKARSDGRSILSPMREGISSHLTVFHDGTALQSIQYTGGGGSGQFLRGTCAMEQDPEGGS